MIVDKLKFRWQYGDEGRQVVTMCMIEDMDNNFIAGGNTTCGENDQFCRETGRRKSLARALKKASIKLFIIHEKQKIWRAEVWEAYRTMTKVPRWTLKKHKNPTPMQRIYEEAAVKYGETLKKLAD